MRFDVIRVILITFFVTILSAAPEFFINDQANLLRAETRNAIEQMSADLLERSQTYFLLLTETREQIGDFDEDARKVFGKFIQDVPDYRGMMLYIQVEKGTDRGKIRFATGYGLRGVFEFEKVRRILKEEILKFREDLTNQKPLIDGLRSYFEILSDSQIGRDPELDADFFSLFLGKKIIWFLGLLIVSICIGSVLFVYSKTKCPRCSSKLHINIRPLYKSESPYKRIKIIKCFDCNYFRKYLF